MMTVSTEKLKEELQRREFLLPTITIYTEGRERDVNITLKGSVDLKELYGLAIDDAVAYVAQCIVAEITPRTNAMQDILDSPDQYVRDVGGMFFRTPDVQDQRMEVDSDWQSIGYTVYFRILIRKRTPEYTASLADRCAAEDLLHAAGLYAHSRRMRLIRDAVDNREYHTHVAAAQELIKMHEMKQQQERV